MHVYTIDHVYNTRSYVFDFFKLSSCVFWRLQDRETSQLLSQTLPSIRVQPTVFFKKKVKLNQIKKDDASKQQTLLRKYW